MSNEAKRDVFDEVLEEWQVDETMPDANWKYPDFKLVRVKEKRFKDRYDAALPDDLPVIPESVGEWIKKCKLEGATLADTLCMEMRPQTVRWWMEFKDGKIAKGFDSAGYRRKQETMAKAWVLGVWRVEETGEVVKL